jgi:GTP-binding protein Era
MTRAGFVSILGRPNAGKSSLLNALVGTKLAIVASQPQTTRAAIQGVVNLPFESGDAQIVFTDTPGIHKSHSMLSRRMMQAARGAAEADVLLFVIDALAPPSEEDSQAVDLAKKSGAPAVAVLNKIDRLKRKPKLLELIERYQTLHDFAAFVPVSAHTGEGLDGLRREIVARLPEGPPLFPADYLTDQPERFRAAELIREKVLHLTRQEVPHAVAVMIESWEDTPKLLRIAATIYVERPGQKAILIGAGGSTLKKIGMQARLEAEVLLERKVFLRTFVKVRPNWREEPEFMGAVDWRSDTGA